jgi:vitamin B12 transporter
MIRRATMVALVATVARTAAADESPEVEVRGDAIASPPKEPSVAGSVIREARLRGPGLEAGDVLRSQPGVVVLETGGLGAPSTANIRGATGAQTPVYLAGVRLNDDVGGTADLSLVPLWLIHRVEVYRSNAPLAGDQLGIGGAIFFEPRRPKSTEVGAGVMGGSYGAHANWALVGLGGQGASALVGARIDGAANDYTFVNDSGTRFVPGNSHTVLLTNADTRTLDVWAMGSVTLGAEGRADLVAEDVEREGGLPFALFPTTHARTSVRRRLAGLTSGVPCAGHKCEVTMTAAVIATQARYDDPLREAGLGTTGLEIDATRVDEGAVVRWILSERVSITPAVRASIERLAMGAANGTSLDAQRIFSRAALQGEWNVSNDVTLRALGSAECNGTSLNGLPPWSLPGDVSGASRGSETCNQFQPAARAGVELGHAPMTLLATIGRYARVPTLTELYGISGAVRGNTALEPETGVSVEAGVRGTASPTSALRGASVDVFGFVRTASHVIAFQRSSIGYVRPFNVGSARVAGLELLAAYSPAAAVLFELSATLRDPRDTSPARPANDILPFQPRLAVAPRVELRSRLAAPPIESGKLSVSYLYEANRYADPAGLDVIPAQSSLDVEAEIGALRDHLTVRGRVANLLDQTRFDLIGYPLPGRAAYVAMEAKW